MKQTSIRTIFDKLTERDMDILIMDGISNNKDFANLFLDKADLFGGEIISIEHSRVSLIYGETDICLIVAHNGQKSALLIEDKIDAPAQPRQYERYVDRGREMEKNGEVDSHKVFIVCPESYRNTNSAANKYPLCITYDELAELCDKTGDVFKKTLFKQAISAQKKGYIPQKDEAVTEFWKRYYKYRQDKYPALNLPETEGDRGSNATWPTFKTNHKQITICHKSDREIVDMQFSGLGEHIPELKALLEMITSPDMKLVKASKSAAIRLKVPKVDFHSPFDSQMSAVDSAMKAVSRLTTLANILDCEKLYSKILGNM